MGFFEKLKEITNRIFNKGKIKELAETQDFYNISENNLGENLVQEAKADEEKILLNLPEGELVPFEDEVLDTNSQEAIEKLKHNLAILAKQAKEKRKVDNFMIIREDNFFPTNWEWRVLSKDTNLEPISTNLSFELRKAYALKQAGIEPFKKVFNVTVPNASREETFDALAKVDKNIGSVLLPSRFRSTKHFTVNTPLEATGNYNAVDTNRDYIIMDDMNEFLKSGYAYSVSYHDAYLDVSHESLPISQKAIVLINDEKYERIMKDKKIAEELSKRKVVRFKGSETLAINMVLSENGVLPSTVGSKYAEYDSELYSILDDSIKNLAEENNLFFDKSHAGKQSPDGGHFSNYYDDQNRDYNKAEEQFLEFLSKKFPNEEENISRCLNFRSDSVTEMIDRIGVELLLSAINEYNINTQKQEEQTLEEYLQDRKNITPEIHQKFTSGVKLVNEFYKTKASYEFYEGKAKTEENIRQFFQSSTVAEQLKALEEIEKVLPEKMEPQKEEKLGKIELKVEEMDTNGITNNLQNLEGKNLREENKNNTENEER